MQQEVGQLFSRKGVYQNTPEVSVYSSAGLVVRQLGYYRREAEEAAEVRISLQRYNSAGQLNRLIDPRLSNAYLNDPVSVIPNQQQLNTLSGNVLQNKNVDAGTRVLFSDVRGQALWSWDSRGTENAFEYDALRRMKAVLEKERGKVWRCTERLRYGETADQELRNTNKVGRLIEHYDTAGLRVALGYSLLGQVYDEVRYFIEAEEVVNWTESSVEN
ncbi:MAG: hypothetical protein V4700_06255 [Pseudomonadota bacterium]